MKYFILIFYVTFLLPSCRHTQNEVKNLRSCSKESEDLFSCPVEQGKEIFKLANEAEPLVAYSWLRYLYNKETGAFCLANFINSSTAITPASCVASQSSTPYQIYLINPMEVSENRELLFKVEKTSLNVILPKDYFTRNEQESSKDPVSIHEIGIAIVKFSSGTSKYFVELANEVTETNPDYQFGGYGLPGIFPEANLDKVLSQSKIPISFETDSNYYPKMFEYDIGFEIHKELKANSPQDIFLRGNPVLTKENKLIGMSSLVVYRTFLRFWKIKKRMLFINLSADENKAFLAEHL